MCAICFIIFFNKILSRNPSIRSVYDRLLAFFFIKEIDNFVKVERGITFKTFVFFIQKVYDEKRKLNKMHMTRRPVKKMRSWPLKGS